MHRVLGIVFGVGTQAFFLVTVWFLFWFLKDGGPRNLRGALWIDALLAMQFAAPHSLLLLPPVRKWLGNWITREFYPLFYCCRDVRWPAYYDRLLADKRLGCLGAARCGQLCSPGRFLCFLDRAHLQPQPVRFRLSDRLAPMVGLGSPPADAASQSSNRAGPILWLRHPVYLSFAGLIWFTPR